MATNKKTVPAARATPSAHRKALRLHGSIARDLGIAIVSGHYKPGDVLDGEIEASDLLRVSRTAYREAVRILSAKGLVESRPKTGTRVNGHESWNVLDPDVLAWIFQVEPDEKLLANLFELRRIVEPEAAALAAVRRSTKDLDEMSGALERMAEHTLAVDEGRKADHDFHAALLRASGNIFLASLTSGVGAAVTWTTIFKQRKRQLARDPIPDHRRVYDAIAAGNPQSAHKAMATLIDLAFGDTKIASGLKNRRRLRTV